MAPSHSEVVSVAPVASVQSLKQRRTIVVFQGPSVLLYLESTDLVEFPQAGMYMVFFDQRYEIKDVNTSPAVYDARRTHRRTGDEKLMEVLESLFTEEIVGTFFLRLRNIGSGINGADEDVESMTAGGLRLPSSGSVMGSAGALLGEFDDVFVVRMVRSELK